MICNAHNSLISTPPPRIAQVIGGRIDSLRSRSVGVGFTKIKTEHSYAVLFLFIQAL